MYKEKEQMLREKELQRMVIQYLYYRRDMATPGGVDWADFEKLSYDNLPCSEEEKQDMREYAEQRLPELEENLPELKLYLDYIRELSWPLNLMLAIFGIYPTFIPDSDAEEVLMSLLKELHPMEEKCMLMFYKDEKDTEEICDELNIHMVELDERISVGLRKLKHPSKARKLWAHLIPITGKTPIEEVLSVCKTAEELNFILNNVTVSDDDVVPVPDKYKEAAVRLVKETGVAKEKITTAFIQRNLKVKFPIAYALKNYIKEAL